MKVEFVEEKRSKAQEEHDTEIYGIRLLAETDLEKGILGQFNTDGIKINAIESGSRWLELTFRSLIKHRQYPPSRDYEVFKVHVHKDWLPMLQAMQEAGTFGTKKPSMEDILDGLILRKLQDGRDALSNVMHEVNAPKDEEGE